MTIKITAGMLAYLTDGKFTNEACEAICEYFEECGSPDCAPYIGDIVISFCEIDAKDVDEYDEECVVAWLDNGNVLVTM